jgi:hypothetical protein
MYERKYQARTVKGANHDSCHEVREGTGHIGEEGWSDIPTKHKNLRTQTPSHFVHVTLLSDDVTLSRGHRVEAAGTVPSFLVLPDKLGDEARNALRGGELCITGLSGVSPGPTGDRFGLVT